MPSRPTARAGMALILTLAAIVLAGGLALFMQARAAGVARVEQAELEGERLRLAAAEAARDALWGLAADEDLAVDHLGEEWALPRETNRADGVATAAIVEDAGRFFNWNNVSTSNRNARSARDVLLDLMTICGDFRPVERVDALADYTDADDDGAYEAAFYRAGDVPFAPPNRALWAPAELLRVHGFSADLFLSRARSANDDLFGGDLATAAVVVPAPLKAPIPVNVNTAGQDVLLGVAGLEQESAVRAVLAVRQMQPFESLGMLFQANPELAAVLEGKLSVASTYFRVRAQASSDSQQRSVMAWVERSPKGDIRILQWFEEGG